MTILFLFEKTKLTNVVKTKLFFAGLIIFCELRLSGSPIEEILKAAPVKKVNTFGLIMPGERPPRYQEPGRNPYEPGYPD